MDNRQELLKKLQILVQEIDKAKNDVDDEKIKYLNKVLVNIWVGKQFYPFAIRIFQGIGRTQNTLPTHFLTNTLNNYKSGVENVIAKLQDGILPASKGGLIGTMRGISEYDSLACIKELYDAASDVDLFYSKECHDW